jgi:peptide/nickel transport system substrate-binding protein
MPRRMSLKQLAAIFLLSAPALAHAQDLRVAVAAFPTSLGVPYTGVSQPSSELWLSIFDALTVLDWGKEAKPGLALSWRSTSPTRWEFQLRPGVTFHDGRPFTANDAVRTLQILKSPEGSAFLVAGETQNIATMRALDDLTLEVETKVPDAILPKRLSIMMIVDADQWQKAGRAGVGRAPNGTGPYRLISWGAGDRDASLEAFPGSWRAPQAVQRLRYRVILEHNARVQALLAGQVDMVTGLQVEDIDDLRTRGLSVAIKQNPQVKSIAMRNVRSGPHPFKDVRVRQAFNYAVDKDAITQLIMLGHVAATGQGLMPGTTGYNDDIAPYPYDPAKARALLAQAGYAKGLDVVFAVVTTTGTPDAQSFQKVAQDLAAVGVKAELQSITFADYQSRYTSGKWDQIDGFSQLWNNAAFQDPIRPIEYFSCIKINPFFCDDAMVPDIRAINAEFDVTKRESLIRALMAKIHEAAPAIWISNNVYLTGYNERVTHFEMLPTGLTFERMRIATP